MGLRARLRENYRMIKRLTAAARHIVHNDLAKYPEIVLRFEAEFAAYIGCLHGASFSSGTSSLEAALFAIGVTEGDRVLVPAFTFHSSISPVLNAGAQPIFVDVDRSSSNIDIEDFKRKSAPGVKAAVVTHLWGNPLDMDELMRVSAERGIAIIEDCSHAHGAEWAGRKVGSFGKAGCFSLQNGKPVSSGGEGGIAVTSDRLIWERMLLFGHFDRVQGESRILHHRLYGRGGWGHKMRAHPLALALASVDLRNLEDDNARRREILRAFREKLDAVPGLRVLACDPGGQPGGMYGGVPVVLEAGSAQEAAERLAQLHINARSSNYEAWHLDPFMVDVAYRQAVASSMLEAPGAPGHTLRDECPNATEYVDRVLLIELDEEVIRRRSHALIAALALPAHRLTQTHSV